MELQTNFSTTNEIPIGYGTTLESNYDEFFTKKMKILSNETLNEFISESKDRNIFKEQKTVYEVNKQIFESQKFSMENSLGIPQIMVKLGIENSTTNQVIDRSLLYVMDYKYVVTKYELSLNLKTFEDIWEHTTPRFKEAVKELKDDNTTTLVKTNRFIDVFGSHLITKSDSGYRLRKIFKTDKKENEFIKDFKIDSELRIMEYVGLSMEYTSKKVKNYDIDSEESEILILGNKSNVLATIKGTPLTFPWTTETVIDAEIIDIHPQSYIPLYKIIPESKYPNSYNNLKRLIEEREYEIAIGWDKGRNYCCAYIEMDPKFFLGECVIDLKLDDNREYRTVIDSTRFQKQFVEFLDQDTLPETLTVNCNKWKRLGDDTTIRIYFKDNNTYLSVIPTVVNRINDNPRTYFLKWELSPLEHMIAENPKDRSLK